MSDTNTGTPVGGNGPAPITPDTEGNDFDANWQSFLTHEFDRPEEEAEGDQTSEEQGQNQNQDPEPEPAAAPQEQQQTQAPNADAPAGTTAPAAAAGDDEISPELMAAMLGFTQTPAGQAPPQAAPETQQTQGNQTQQTQDAADEPYMPFAPTFKLPPQLTAALFEAEDSGTREQALIALLCNFGNAAVAMMDERVKSHYMPRAQEQFLASQSERQVVQQTQADFYGAYPDLKPYAKVVAQATQAVYQANPNQPYSPEMRDRIGKLARTFLAKNLPGYVIPGQQQQQQQTQQQVRKPPARTPFIAGAARPDGLVEGQTPTGPEALVADLMDF